MQKTDKFLEERLIWKAKQYNFPTEHAFYYNDLPSNVQELSLTSIPQEKSGTPVLLFTTLTKQWTLLCTRQIVWGDGQIISSLNYSEIKSARPTELDKWNPPEHKKNEWKEITITDKKNAKIILTANPGKDFFALLNILLMMFRISYDSNDTSTDSIRE